MKKLFVGNIPHSTTEAELRALFEPHGAIEQVSIVTDRDTGRSRGFAFVEMTDSAEAEKAIAALNGKELGGRALNINEARPKTDRGGPPRGGRPGGGWWDVPAAVDVLAAVAGVTTIRVTRGSLESRAGNQQGKLETLQACGLICGDDLRRRIREERSVKHACITCSAKHVLRKLIHE